MLRRNLLLAVILPLAALTVTAHADAPIMDFTGGQPTSVADNPFTFGYSFNVTGTLDIVGLGFFNPTVVPYSGARQVGLWNVAGDLVASATVDPATASEIPSTSGEGVWLEQRITPVDLKAGGYTLGQLLEANDVQMWFVNPVSIAPVTFGSGMENVSGILLDPVDPDGFRGTFGPTAFVETSSPTPEFSTIAMMISGAGGMFLQVARQRRRRKAA
jgi:hypothetical protein